MPLFNARDALAFPAGDNSSDTVISNIHFNLTTLENWNYTLYSNGTLSNGSWCLLTFQPYTPSYVLPNGTFLNVTWCWSPTEPIGVRAGVAIGYAVLFGIALVLSLVCLNKHGKLHLPAEKRFFPIGRRWQWYWGSWVCATAIISLLTCVDVDRYFLPELPIILTSFFWYLMQWAVSLWFGRPCATGEAGWSANSSIPTRFPCEMATGAPGWSSTCLCSSTCSSG